MIKKLRKEKPEIIKSLPNVSTNLIMNVSEMTPWWVHYNKLMILLLIKIEINTDQIDCADIEINTDHNDHTSYYDHHKKKWLKCKRIMFNGGPSCYPI